MQYMHKQIHRYREILSVYLRTVKYGYLILPLFGCGVVFISILSCSVGCVNILCSQMKGFVLCICKCEGVFGPTVYHGFHLPVPPFLVHLS